jgi:hypothetical protein
MGLSSMTCSQFSGPMIAEKFPFSGMRSWKSSATVAAQVCSAHQVVDPYGVCPDLPAKFDCIGGFDFARAAGTSCGSNLETRLRQLARRSGCGHAIDIYHPSSTKCLSKE